MTYDYKHHRYVLTDQALLEELGISFANLPESMDANPSTRAQRFCKTVSANVYRYITKESLNKGWLLYEMATVPDLRDVIYQMLLDQAIYNFKSGFIEEYSGIDVFQGSAIDGAKIEDAKIASNVKNEAEVVIQPCLGRTLKYAGVFGFAPPPFIDKEGNPVY